MIFNLPQGLVDARFDVVACVKPDKRMLENNEKSIWLLLVFVTHTYCAKDKIRRFTKFTQTCNQK